MPNDAVAMRSGGDRDWPRLASNSKIASASKVNSENVKERWLNTHGCETVLFCDILRSCLTEEPHGTEPSGNSNYSHPFLLITN